MDSAPVDVPNVYSAFHLRIRLQNLFLWFYLPVVMSLYSSEFFWSTPMALLQCSPARPIFPIVIFAFGALMPTG